MTSAEIRPLTDQEIQARIEDAKIIRSAWVSDYLRPLVINKTSFIPSGDVATDSDEFGKQLTVLVRGFSFVPSSGLLWLFSNDAAAVIKTVRELPYFQTCQLADKDSILQNTILKSYNPDGETYKPTTKGPKPHLTIGDLERELESRGASVRLNTMTQEPVITGFETGDFSKVATILYSELCNRFRGCGIDVIANFLQVLASRKRFSPVVDIINNASADGSVIDRLFIMMGLDRDEFGMLLLEKFIRQCVALAYADDEHPVTPDGMLVIMGPQGYGKSALLKKMSLEYFNDNVSCTPLTFQSADNYRRLSECFIAEIPEIDRVLSKNDMSTILKTEITVSSVRYRKPYARSDTHAAKHFALAGTTNSPSFLSDPSGTRKFWVIRVTKRMDYNEIQKIDVAAMYRYFRDNPRPFHLTADEIKKLDERNRLLMCPVQFQDDVLEYFASIENSDCPRAERLLTAKQFGAGCLDLPTSTDWRKVGKALQACGYGPEEKLFHGCTVYKIPVLQTIGN